MQSHRVEIPSYDRAFSNVNQNWVLPEYEALKLLFSWLESDPSQVDSSRRCDYGYNREVFPFEVSAISCTTLAIGRQTTHCTYSAASSKVSGDRIPVVVPHTREPSSQRNAHADALADDEIIHMKHLV